MTTEQDFMTRDLPAETDFEDPETRYGTQFDLLSSTDDAYAWPNLLDFYQGAGEEERRTINNVFLYLVGYTLPTIVERAHGGA